MIAMSVRMTGNLTPKIALHRVLAPLQCALSFGIGHVVAGFSPRSTSWKQTRAKARDYILDSTSGNSFTPSLRCQPNTLTLLQGTACVLYNDRQCENPQKP